MRRRFRPSRIVTLQPQPSTTRRFGPSFRPGPRHERRRCWYVASASDRPWESNESRVTRQSGRLSVLTRRQSRAVPWARRWRWRDRYREAETAGQSGNRGREAARRPRGVTPFTTMQRTATQIPRIARRGESRGPGMTPACRHPRVPARRRGDRYPGYRARERPEPTNAATRPVASGTPLSVRGSWERRGSPESFGRTIRGTVSLGATAAVGTAGSGRDLAGCGPTTAGRRQHEGESFSDRM